LVQVSRSGAPSVRQLASADLDDPITSLVSLGARRLVAASSRGVILRSDDGGIRWDRVADLGLADAQTPAPVELYTSLRNEGVRVWARAHGGGLLSSDDGGAHWEGPTESVRACAFDPQASDGLRIVSAPHLEARAGGRALRLTAVPSTLACAGSVWVFCFSRGAGAISADGGASLSTCALLSGATALALLPTDDGAIQLVAAIHDDGTDRSTLIRAGIAPDGTLVGARRIAKLSSFGAPADGSDDAQNRIEAIVPFDGERLLLIATGGVAVAESG
jgi:hypothetical protein